MINKILKIIRDLHKGRKGDFFVNFYATLSGVFISLISANIISSYNEQKDVNQSLSFIKQELIENKQTADLLYKHLRKEKTAMRYLYSFADKLDSIPPDSLEYHGLYALKKRHFSFSFNALESAKMSGSFSKIQSQELSLEISKAYAAVLYLQEIYEEYLDRKDTLKNEIKENPEIRRLEVFTEASNWKLFLKYDAGWLYLSELPLLQPSKDYRIHIKKLAKAIQLLEEHHVR